MGIEGFEIGDLGFEMCDPDWISNHRIQNPYVGANMSELIIVKYPDPVLRKKAAPITRMTPEIREFIARMHELMQSANGVGLAAPQVGISLRIIIVDAGDGAQTLINPQIHLSEGHEQGSEGCLSLPRLYGEVMRAERVVVRAMNDKGRKITLSGEGLWARAIQHEIDHLDGVLFTDRVRPDTLVWMTDDVDDEGKHITRATSLEDALRYFERQAALLRV